MRSGAASMSGTQTDITLWSSGSGAAANDQALDAELPALRQRLLRHARFALHDHDLAEDLVQDTLITVLEQQGRRRGDASLSTWATAILKNKVADWYRAPGQRRRVQLGENDERLGATVDALFDAQGAYVDPVPRWQQPENQLEQRQMMTTLEGCLGRLPAQTGRVFMMREWVGFETSEICQRLGISAENCRTLLHRARTGLRNCMQHDWIENRANV